MDELKNIFATLDKLTEIMHEVYPELKTIEEPGMFLSLMFTMIDQYAADHDIPSDEIIEMTKIACDAQVEAHKELGEMIKSAS